MGSGQKTWFITGCSTGFGRVLATHVLRRGDRVALTARNPETLSDLVDAFPSQARAYRLDVSNHEEMMRVVEDVEYDFAPIDYLVNNAGFVAVGTIEELRPADYRKVFETNFFGALELIRTVLPFMRQRRSGTIINISALGGIVANAGLGYYCASKHALEAVSEALSEEVAPLNIRVLIVEPGQFRTEAMAKRFEALQIPDYEDVLRP